MSKVFTFTKTKDGKIVGAHEEMELKDFKERYPRGYGSPVKHVMIDHPLHDRFTVQADTIEEAIKISETYE